MLVPRNDFFGDYFLDSVLRPGGVKVYREFLKYAASSAGKYSVSFLGGKSCIHSNYIIVDSNSDSRSRHLHNILFASRRLGRIYVNNNHDDAAPRASSITCVRLCCQQDNDD